MLEYRSPFDASLVEQGPPAVFTVDAKGRLGLDEMRTWEHWTRVQPGPEHTPCHCLYRDRATGFVQYVLVTSAALCASHPRAEVRRFADQQEALDTLSALGEPPIARVSWEADQSTCKP